ncbi:MAG: hypothetical protein IJU76_08140 [Desulfovibrionaceae bacterium]|nr:hypothetical protein [Desulfovibrionaceae bacterium]
MEDVDDNRIRELFADIDRLRAEMDAKEKELRIILGVKKAGERGRTSREKKVVCEQLMRMAAM